MQELLRKSPSPSSPFHRKTNPLEEGAECPSCGGPLGILGSLGNRMHYQCRNCGMQTSTSTKGRKQSGFKYCSKCGKQQRKLFQGLCKFCVREGNPPMRGIPSWMANDPSFRQELAAYTKRHGRGPVKITQVNVPAGYPKYMSVYGKAPEIKYDAPAHSNKGRRIHKFGEGGGRPPWLATSVSRGPKFLSFVGGTFKAKDWIYK
jgi:ssDNA-binding Zn-finger/Zn-ribbon topoisomerase 1